MNGGRRKDNVGTLFKEYDPEPIGSILCETATGTGYNANNQQFGNAAENKGNCKGQFRVSGKGSTPVSCGNRDKK